jgi:phosphoribosylformylglycinamidine cyclo-ligase
VVDVDSWRVPQMFERLADAGGVERHEMFRTFNMGVGMIVITDPASVPDIIAATDAHGVRGWKLGRVVEGSGQVILN